MRQAACFFVLLGAATVYGSAQLQPPVVKTATTGVIIDASVLDKNGQPVLDLSRDDFELTENGARQQIVSATLVRGGAVRSSSGTSAAPNVAAQASDASRSGAPGIPAAAGAGVDDTTSVTAILFDRLSPEVRPLARRAALAYVSTLSPPHEYAGVFLADLTFTTFQPFTNQADSLRAAVDRLAATAPSNLTEADRFRGRYAPRMDPNQPATAGAESASGFFHVGERQRILASLDPGERQMAEIELRMEEGYRQFVAEYGGQASLAGLKGVVTGLGGLPGRKSLLYFTENLILTTALKPKFDALIGQANRANITIYTVDAVGLRVHSKEAELARNVSVAGAQGVGDEKRGDGPWTKDLEKQDQLLSSRPTASLGRLAKETGGFLLENTNDLAAGVARMQQERTTYYLLTYQSTNPALDGSFRRVSVKVKRPKVTVRARPGYVAAPLPQ